ncbi:MAG: Uma2 family endonuclease [Nitrospirae bacterium]|nr:Uma2 family endonuclease [Nitrospirota bacterium]
MPTATLEGKYTYEDYAALPDDKRYELIEGELIMTPPPIIRHQMISGEVDFAIRSFVRQRRSGRVFSAPTDVVLDNDVVVQPDVLFISNERAGIIGEANIQGAPDIVVEIVSESSAHIDFGRKKRLYDRYGVAEYWIVIPDAEAVEVFSRTEKGLVLSRRYEKWESLESGLLAGFRMELSELF